MALNMASKNGKNFLRSLQVRRERDKHHWLKNYSDKVHKALFIILELYFFKKMKETEKKKKEVKEKLRKKWEKSEREENKIEGSL